MLDTDALNLIIFKSGIRKGELIKRLGMSPPSFYRKMSGEREFTRTELEKFIEVLDMTDPINIFF